MKITKLILIILTLSLLLCACNQAGKNPDTENSSNDNSSSSSSNNNDVDTPTAVNLKTIYNTCTAQDNSTLYFFDRAGIYKMNINTGEVTRIYELKYGHGMILHNKYIYFIDGSKLCRIDVDGGNFIEFEKETEISGYDRISLQKDILSVTIIDSNSEARTIHFDISGDPNVLKKGSFDPILDKTKKMTEITAFLEDKTSLPQNSFSIKNYSDKYIYYIKSGLPMTIQRFNLETNKTEGLATIEIKQSYFDIIDGWIYYWGKDGAMVRTKEDLSKTEVIGIAGSPLKLEDLM